MGRPQDCDKLLVESDESSGGPRSTRLADQASTARSARLPAVLRHHAASSTSDRVRGYFSRTGFAFPPHRGSTHGGRQDRSGALCRRAAEAAPRAARKFYRVTHAGNLQSDVQARRAGAFTRILRRNRPSPPAPRPRLPIRRVRRPQNERGAPGSFPPPWNPTDPLQHK